MNTLGLFVKPYKCFSTHAFFTPVPQPYTVDREIFAVKNFSSVAQVAKIKREVMYVDLYQVQPLKPGGENQTTRKIYRRNILPVKISIYGTQATRCFATLHAKNENVQRTRLSVSSMPPRPYLAIAQEGQLPPTPVSQAIVINNAVIW